MGSGDAGVVEEYLEQLRAVVTELVGRGKTYLEIWVCIGFDVLDEDEKREFEDVGRVVWDMLDPDEGG